MGNSFSKKDIDNNGESTTSLKIDSTIKNNTILKKKRSNSWPSDQFMDTDVRQDLDSIFFY